MDKKLRQLEEEQRRLMEEIDKNNRRLDPSYKKHEKNELIEFIVGLILLGGGLFWIFHSVKVTTLWSFRLGGRTMPEGIVVIPLLIGIVMLFVMRRKIFGWIVSAIGVLAILITIMSSVSFYFIPQSLFSYILMFGFTVVGAALVIKALFAKN